VQSAEQTSQQPVQNNVTVRPLEQGEPRQAQVPAGGVLPINGLLPEGALPPGVATHVPQFGLLGPDPKALTAHSMSAGEATALPDREPPRAPELVAVGLLAIMAGLLARTIGPRMSRRTER
jgi:hypothetical protein